jgi:alpha-galactosidase
MAGPKITFIGGGSAKFVSELVKDVFSYDQLRESRICLMDIDAERLDRAKRMVTKLITDLKIGASVETTMDQREAVRGSDYVVISVMVGGFKHYKSDATIPMKYGVLPTVGDTIGPGGVFRLVRSAPVLFELARNLRELAPNAWVLNYANPMAMNTWTLIDAGHQRTVGLCHSIQGSYRQIAGWLNINPDEVRYTAAGINHVNFYLTLTHNGRDLYPDLLAAAPRILEKHPNFKVTFELLKYFGHWVAEGPEHQSEYSPYFRKSQATADHYSSETMWGYNFDSKLNGWLLNSVEEMISGKKPICYDRGHEYGSGIINALHTNEAVTVYGNVRNDHLIDNLPQGALVEVPCHVDGNGIFPIHMGRIPTKLAAIMTPHIHVHEMALEGVKKKSRRIIREAITADPLTAAICTLPQIEAMVDELFVENADWTKDWPEERRALAAAKA